MAVREEMAERSGQVAATSREVGWLVGRLVALALEGPGRIGWTEVPSAGRGRIGWYDGIEGDGSPEPAVEIARHDGHGWLLAEQMPGVGLVLRTTTPEFLANSFWQPLRRIVEYATHPDHPACYDEVQCLYCGELFDNDRVLLRRVEGGSGWHQHVPGRCGGSMTAEHFVADRKLEEIQAVQRAAGLLTREQVEMWRNSR